MEWLKSKAGEIDRFSQGNLISRSGQEPLSFFEKEGYHGREI
jgi:hypothetical protein